MGAQGNEEVCHPPKRSGCRLALAVFVPAAVFFLIWVQFVKDKGLRELFGRHEDGQTFPTSYVPVLMVFGSLVAGSTHQGSASIAFPVMSLLLGASPVVARDFAFLIQSVGMTSAAFSIVILGVECDIQALVVCTMAGIVGLIFGLEAIAPHLSTPVVHMAFVAISLSFAMSLFWWPGKQRDTTVEDVKKPSDEDGLARNVRGGILFGAGLIGGVLSALFGAGLGTCAFAALTHAFQVPHRVAVPTSVILMAVNTCVGALYRTCFMQIDGLAWTYFTVGVPVVAFGAPLGLVLADHFGSLFWTHVVHIFHTALFFIALLLVKPWDAKAMDHPVTLLVSTGVLIFVGVALIKMLGCLRSTETREVSYSQLDVESQGKTSATQCRP